ARPTAQGTFQEVVAQVHARTIGLHARSKTAVPPSSAAAVPPRRSRSSVPVPLTTADDERILAAAALGARLLAHSRKNASHVVAPLNVALAVKQVEFLRR